MIERNRIEEYINSIKYFFLPFLKLNTKVKTNVFPYNEGTLFVMRFCSGNGTVFESDIRSSSETLYEAIQRTGVLSINNRNQSVQKKTLLLGNSSLVFIIPDNMFNVASAESDVKLIVKSIRKK